MAPEPADIGADVNTWINVVRRSRLHATTKLIALLLASYASPDGTSVYPGVARLAIQSRKSYRTVQAELRRLRAIGLVEKLPRSGLPRSFAVPYRLILGPDVLEKADVPTPATEDAAVENLKARYRGRHRPKKSARNLDDVQTDDCMQWDDTTARNGQLADQPQRHQTLHVPLPVSNPPFAESGVVARGTGSTRARADANHDFSGSNPEEDKRRAAHAALAAWEAAHPGSAGQ